MIGYRWEAERSDEVMRARQEMRDEREMKTNNYHTLIHYSHHHSDLLDDYGREHSAL